MSTPNLPGLADQSPGALARLARLRDMLPPEVRFGMVRAMLVNMRDNFYPDMHILQKADGSLQITVAKPEAGGQ